MSEKKWVKVKPTRTDSTGSGYYRAEDGTYLYGNPKNGYMTLTLEEQKKRRLEAEAQSATETERQRKLAEREAYKAARAEAERARAGSDGLFTGLLMVGFLGSLLAVCLYCAIVFGLFYSVTTLWPRYIKSTLWGLLHIFRGLTLTETLGYVLQAAHISVLVLLFVKVLRKPEPAQPPKAEARSFTRPAYALTFVVYLILGTAESWESGIVMALIDGLLYALLSAMLLVLPALILYYRAYRANGSRGFVRHLAQSVCNRLPGKNKIPFVVGILTILFALITLLAVIVGPGSINVSSIMPVVTFLLAGVFSVVFGKLGGC